MSTALERALEKGWLNADVRLAARRRGRTALGGDRRGTWYLPAAAGLDTTEKALRVFIRWSESRGDQRDRAALELKVNYSCTYEPKRPQR